MKRRLQYSSIAILCILIVILISCYSNKKQTDYDHYPSYTGEDLELMLRNGNTYFTLWSPMAQEVKLNLYENGVDGTPIRTISMKRKNQKSPWRTKVNGLQYGKFYTFQVKINEQWLEETPGAYPKAVGVNGNRAAIIDMKTTNPNGWDQDVRPALKSFSDIILYELHYRDFSIDTTSGITHKGKFLALTENGTTSPLGEKTGIDHLKELGITHVHILPSYDFGSINETTLWENKYNWGYDPKNYNAPEGSYSTNPYDPATRIREFKEMVMALHKAGIRVIMDVVYNHTYLNENSNFSLTTPGYYYRHNPDGSFSDASNCGNETASEREMVRHYIIQSALYWINEYHIDGFRFDLMGIHDIETMNILRQEMDKIDPSLFIYGEGWTAGPSPYPQEKRAMKVNIPQMPGIAAFNDDLRDAVKGSYKDDALGGFIHGEPKMEESIKFGIVGATRHPQVNYDEVNYSSAPWALEPVQSINYVSSHDDLCLTDKIIITTPNTDTDKRKALAKLAQTIVFTSQGIPFMFNGEEVFRSKKLVHNSFESPDSINQINWLLKTTNKDLFEYYRNLIQLRKEHPAFRIEKRTDIVKHLEFLDTPDGVVGYILKDNANGDQWEQIIVLFNGQKNKQKIKIPTGQWNIIIENGVIDLTGIRQWKGNEIEIAPQSALIMHNVR